MTAAFIVIVAITFNFSFSQAQDGQINLLQDQMSDLIGQMTKSNELINQLVTEKNAQQEVHFESSAEFTNGIDPVLNGTGTPAGRCIDGYTSWPTSDVYKESPWENHFINPDRVSGNDTRETSTFLDVNGDGLVDYLYSSWLSGFGGSRYLSGCVMLNNGAGWDPAYRCYMGRPDNVTPWTFWGDCADV